MSDELGDDADDVKHIPEDIKGDINIQLINAIKEYEWIYNPRHRYYSHVKKKRQTWEAISKKIGLKHEEARNKWKRLRTYYREVLIRDAIAKEESKQSPKWTYTNDLNFIKPYIGPLDLAKSKKLKKRELQLDNMDWDLKDDISDEDLADFTAYENQNQELEAQSEETENPNGTDMFLLSMAEEMKQLPEGVQKKLKYQIFTLVNKAKTTY